MIGYFYKKKGMKYIQLQIANERVTKLLDVKTIITKQLEIQKLKMIMLDKE